MKNPDCEANQKQVIFRSLKGNGLLPKKECYF